MGPLDFVAEQPEITADYAEGTSHTVTLHDGGKLMLHKLDGGHDPRDPDAAIAAIRSNAKRGEIATGLLYVNEEQIDLHGAIGTTHKALNEIPCAELCPGSKALDGINARFR
jgi:2-oxoglutarate ferredoxin oxidoreductase subunit beta